MNESHERALISGLFIIEKSLHQIESLLQKGEKSNTIIYFVSDDLKSSTKKGMMESVILMLNEIRRLKEVFKLKPREEPIRRRIYAEISGIWVILEDLMPEKFEAYGKLSENEKELLRPLISTLIQRIRDMLQLLDNNAYIDYEQS